MSPHGLSLGLSCLSSKKYFSAFLSRTKVNANEMTMKKKGIIALAVKAVLHCFLVMHITNNGTTKVIFLDKIIINSKRRA